MKTFETQLRELYDQEIFLYCKCGGELTEGTLNCKDCGISWAIIEDWMKWPASVAR